MSLIVLAAIAAVALSVSLVSNLSTEQKVVSASDVPRLTADTDIFADSDTVVARFILKDPDARLEMKRQPDSSDYEVACGAYIDFSRNEMGIYKACLPDQYQEVAAKCDIAGISAKGRPYSAYFAKENSYELHLTLVDDYSGRSVEVRSNTTVAGIGWGKRSCKVVSGDILIKEFFDLSDQPYHARLAIIGDSFVEGNSLLDERDNRYPFLIKNRLDGDVFINGKGGARSADGVKWINSYLLGAVKPKYMILAFGMNDRKLFVWRNNMNKMCSILEKNDIIPVLVTVTPSSNENCAYEEHMKMNDYIRSSGRKYIDAAKACSKNNDGVTFDSDLFIDDGVHPTIEGHRLIFERALMDVPELFE